MKKKKRVNKAKSLIAQPLFRSRITKDKTKYSRKQKHKESLSHG